MVNVLGGCFKLVTVEIWSNETLELSLVLIFVGRPCGFSVLLSGCGGGHADVVPISNWCHKQITNNTTAQPDITGGPTKLETLKHILGLQGYWFE